MAKGNSHKKSNGSALDFEAQLWAAAEQAVPASSRGMPEFNSARPEGLFLKYISDAFEEKREQLLFGFSDPKSEWFIKDEPQRAEAAENRDATIFGGHGLSTPFPIPTGLHQSAQGCRVREATLGYVIHYFPQPQRGCINRPRARGCNPFRVDKFSGRFPRVARAAQPWAECRNPVGVNKRRDDLPDEFRTLKGVLPRDYARPSLDTATRDSANPICESHRQDFCEAKDHVRLGGLVDIISNIGFNESAAKSSGGRPQGLGRVYEYFLAPWESVPAPAFGSSVQGSPTGRGKFASAFDYVCGEPSEASWTTGTVARRASASDSASQFYTPQCVVQVLVAMLEPYKGRVFETLQSAKTICGNRRMKRDFSLSASIGDLRSLGSDERNSLLVKARCGPSERARVSHWAGVRCRVPSPVNNANYAWIQHFIHHLSLAGVAGFVLAKTTRSAHS